MTAHASDLAVRRHERYVCDLPAQISIEDTAVRISRSVLGSEGKLPARVVDVSRGGIGLSTAVYLPPTCRLRVEFRSAGKVREVLVRVQRAAMSDRKPTFYVGGGFEGEDAERDSVVAGVVAELKAAGAKVMPEKSRA